MLLCKTTSSPTFIKLPHTLPSAHYHRQRHSIVLPIILPIMKTASGTSNAPRALSRTESNGYYAWKPEDEGQVQSAIRFFSTNGYVIFTSHATESEVSELRAAAQRHIEAFQKSNSDSTIFTTNEQKRDAEMNDEYFLKSTCNISCFLEENQENDTAKAVNKIGHALHELDETFKSFSHSAKVRQIAKSMGFNSCKLVQSMYILKNKRIGGAVRSHRDGTFVRGKAGPAGDCLGYWWALEDATLQNGCLWAIPKSHRDGVSLSRFSRVKGQMKVRIEGEDCTKMYGEKDFVALPMSCGDVILLHGGVVHRSLENCSEKSRHAYSIHVVEGGVVEECWLKRPKAYADV